MFRAKEGSCGFLRLFCKMISFCFREVGEEEDENGEEQYIDEE